MKTYLIAAALLSAIASAAPAFADAGHAHGDERAYGEPGNPKQPSRVIQVVMSEADGKMQFIPNKIEIKTGEQVRFVLRNNGDLDHEIVLATLQNNLKHAEEMRKNPDMEHDDPNARRLMPKKTGEIVWKFTKAGTFDFSCLIPGHREAGMFGTIVVK
ncbi:MULTISPECIES: cupredoxin domain-containing protein [Xanthobacter]|uniref:cupredoxin domain-containing protein n=1 Tax=Xanthobacter TaxID=279 RepID=UPI002022C6DD|nr:cupredoxin family protein [Xanthobacter aminoxidans]MCL8383423.1 cupredoxin family protein [Xanthobacter aminoxidans]